MEPMMVFSLITGIPLGVAVFLLALGNFLKDLEECKSERLKRKTKR